MANSDTNGLRIVFYLTDEKEKAHNEAASLVQRELEAAFERGDYSAAGRLSAVLRYLAEVAISWHGGRDLGILEPYEDQLED